MYDFITNLLNIDPSRIRFLSVSVRQDITYYHIALVSTQPEFTFCVGQVHIHARGREKQLLSVFYTSIKKHLMTVRILQKRCCDIFTEI